MINILIYVYKEVGVINMVNYYCSHCLTIYKEKTICKYCGHSVDAKIKIEVQSHTENK